MLAAHACATLDEVRAEIDRVDRALVALIAERAPYVTRAGQLKSRAADIPAPARVEEVVRRVRARARELGAPPEVVERTWRAMIAAFIQFELAGHPTSSPPGAPA